MEKFINFNYKYNSDFVARAKLIKEQGFDGVFIYSQYDPANYIETILLENLKIDSLHLPYKKIVDGECVDSKWINVLWEESQETMEYMETLKSEIDFASNYGISKVVMHVVGGKNPPPISQAGISKIREILEYCVSKKIFLCLENTRSIEHLITIFEKIDSPYLRMCFDSGHANYMTQNINCFPWNILGNKISCVHLNDNDGTKDQHRLPFVGSIKWNDLIRESGKYICQSPLTLEVRASEQDTLLLSEIDYLKKCYESLLLIEKGLTEDAIK